MVLFRSTCYKDQQGLTSQILKATQAIYEPGLTPRLKMTHKLQDISG